MSGSFVLRSGVGTQMLTVSSSFSTAKSVVADNRSGARSAATSSLDTSGMCDCPLLITCTLRASTSMPVVTKPARASSTASGNPTYPEPNDAHPRLPVSIFSSSRSCYRACDM